ncbi:hypothetical protein, partial [Parasutterella excrementihominis]|uniref:hypothetical protein n=1 Tax=Parasutterella excrementihominis TaxID=487175 RepID=UPI00242F0066
EGLILPCVSQRSSQRHVIDDIRVDRIFINPCFCRKNGRGFLSRSNDIGIQDFGLCDTAFF